MKILGLIICFSFITIAINAQQRNYAFGGGLGIGSLLGNFPSQTTFGGKIFLELHHSIKPFDNLQFHFTYAQKVEKFLPGNYNIDYFSFISSIGLSGIFKQKVNEQIFIEEGVGMIFLNDRSFDDINNWNYGISFNLLGEIYIGQNVNLGFGLDYGLTVNNTNISYVLFLIQVKYLF